MIRRTFDAEVVNAIANHPSVLPWVTVPGMDTVDVAPLLSDPANVAVMTETGGFVFNILAPGEYEAHSLFLPEGRGRHAMESAREALHYMFSVIGGETVWARCPVNNRAVMAFTRRLGFKFDHMRHAAWPTSKGPVDEEWFKMTRADWNILEGAN